MPTPQWDFRPDAGAYRILPVGPTVLITDLEDDGQIIRMKSTTRRRIFEGTFTVPPATARSMDILFASRMFDETLTIISHDPRVINTDAEVVVVRFAPPEAVPQYLGTRLVRMLWRFREV